MSTRPEWVGPWDPIQIRRAANALDSILTANATSARFLWERGNGSAIDPDPRRSLEEECGWPIAPGPELYSRLYHFDSIAPRVVSLPPRACWQVQPDVYEVEDEDVTTQFETDFDELGVSMRGEANWFKPQQNKGGHPLWQACSRVDVLSRIGQYGVLWLGFNDGIDPRLPVRGFEEYGSKPIAFTKDKKEPEKLYVENGKSAGYEPYRLVVNKETSPKFDSAKPSTKGMELLFAKPFQESLARVTRWESNKLSPRYLQPLEYQITALDVNGGYGSQGFPSSSELVHWMRCIHVADVHHQACASEILAIPSMQPVLYDLLDGRKISGADGEAFWRNAILKIFFETHPQLGGDALVNDEELRDMMENMTNGMQQHGRLSGMSANPIAPSVADPNPHLDAKYKRIAISMGRPKRIFEGSERGELSSAQDDKQDNDTVAERQNNYLTSHLCAPLINRLILVDVLTEPKEYFIDWPEIGSQDPLIQAQVFSTKMAGYASYVSGDVAQVMAKRQMWIESGKTADEAEAIIEEAEAEAELEEQEAAAAAAELGMVEKAPGEFVDPEQQEKEHEIALESAKAGGKPAFGGPPKANPFAKKGAP